MTILDVIFMVETSNALEEACDRLYLTSREFRGDIGAGDQA